MVNHNIGGEGDDIEAVVVGVEPMHMAYHSDNIVSMFGSFASGC